MVVNHGDDFHRLSKSLDTLEHVLMDDFVTSVVNKVFMEHCKLASYLMRCSYYITTNATNEDNDTNDSISLDFQPTIDCMKLITEVCCGDDTVATAEHQPNTVTTNMTTPLSIERWFIDISRHAPTMFFEMIVSELTKNLLVIALNLDGTTPSISTSGAQTFQKDCIGLFEEVSTSFGRQQEAQLTTDVMPTSSTNSQMMLQRLLDIGTVMTMDTKKMIDIGNALCELCGHEPPLQENMFEDDSRIYEEAISMIRVQKLPSIELSDVLSILNRRQDLY